MSYVLKTTSFKYIYNNAYKLSLKGIALFILCFISYLTFCINFPSENDFSKGFLKKQLIGNQVYSRIKSSLFVSCWARISVLSNEQVTELKQLSNWNQTPPFPRGDMTLDSRGYWFAQDCWDKIPSEYEYILSGGTFETGNFYYGIDNSYMVLFLPKERLLLSMVSHE